MSAAYAVHVVRGVEAWLVYVPALQRATAARTLDQVEPMARQLIAGETGADPRKIKLEVSRPS